MLTESGREGKKRCRNKRSKNLNLWISIGNIHLKHQNQDISL